jgi:Ca2+-binding RTX toxin-like protein
MPGYALVATTVPTTGALCLDVYAAGLGQIGLGGFSVAFRLYTKQGNTQTLVEPTSITALGAWDLFDFNSIDRSVSAISAAGQVAAPGLSRVPLFSISLPRTALPAGLPLYIDLMQVGPDAVFDRDGNTVTLGNRAFLFEPSTNLVLDLDDTLAAGTLSVTGSAQEGGSLAASLTAVTDPDGPTTVTYRWQESVSGNWTDIVGAINATLLIPTDQTFVGKTVRVVATTTDALGGTTSFNSNGQTIVNVDDAATGTLGVTGSAQEGGSLTASLTAVIDPDGPTTVTYRWQESVSGRWTNLVGAINATLVIPADQTFVGKTVRAVATTTDALGGKTIFISRAQIIANVDDAAAGTLSVTGSAQEGGSLAASLTAVTDPDGPTTVTYRWQESVSGNWTDIVGAINATLLIPADQTFVGKTVRVVATTTDALGGTTSFNSNGQTIDSSGGSGVNTLFGTARAEILTGTPGADFLSGLGGNDTLSGDDGDDTLDGGVGLDRLAGGFGSDIFIIDLNATGALQDAVTETVDAGIDTIVLRGTSTNKSPSAITLSPNVENIDARLSASSLINLTGNALPNSILGNDAGNVLIGGLGADRLDGGNGADVYFFSTLGHYTGDIINDTGPTGLDEFRYAATATETLLLTNAVNGIESIVIGTGTARNAVSTATTSININAAALSSAVTIAGNAGANILTGGKASDTLLGGLGSDVLIGGLGADRIDGGDDSDIYFISVPGHYAGDVLFDTGITGIDEIRYAAAAASTLTLTNTISGIESVIVGTGTAQTPLATANTAININAAALTSAVTITGNAGVNTLTGGSGSDTLRGRIGADTLTGGNGSDSFIFEPGDSGPGTAFDSILDFSKGQPGLGDLINFSVPLTVGGAAGQASSTRARIDQSTGIATFAAGSGTTLNDALSDIATNFAEATDSAGEFAFLRVNGSGSYLLFISDGATGFSANDVVIALIGITTLSAISLVAGDLSIA